MAQQHLDPNSQPEKVETHEWTHAPKHTTYYGQQNLSQQGFDANTQPEKVQTLIPEAYRTTGHVINKFNPEVRTTFYA
jgi:hypothetical protein